LIIINQIVTGKNVIKIKRNLSQLLFIFLLPALQVVFFCVAIGRNPTSLPLAVVNSELPNVDGNCTWAPGCDFTNVSCRFFHYLFEEDALVRRHFADRASALAAASDGLTWGVIETPQNFSRFFLKRLWNSIDADQDTLNGSSINVRINFFAITSTYTYM